MMRCPSLVCDGQPPCSGPRTALQRRLGPPAFQPASRDGGSTPPARDPQRLLHGPAPGAGTSARQTPPARHRAAPTAGRLKAGGPGGRRPVALGAWPCGRDGGKCVRRILTCFCRFPRQRRVVNLRSGQTNARNLGPAHAGSAANRRRARRSRRPQFLRRDLPLRPGGAEWHASAAPASGSPRRLTNEKHHEGSRSSASHCRILRPGRRPVPGRPHRRHPRDRPGFVADAHGGRAGLPARCHARDQQPGRVLLSSSFAEAGTEVIVGVGPQRARWRCIAYRDGSTAGIMSLADEGAL